jgi:hypothetical protein
MGGSHRRGLIGLGIGSAVVLIAAAVPLISGSIARGDHSMDAATRDMPSTVPAFRLYEHISGGWSIEYPDGWFVQPWRRQGASFTSYDPASASFERGVRFETLAANPPISELRFHIEVWPNESGWTSKSYADAFLAEPTTVSHSRLLSRDPTRIGAAEAEVAVLQEESPRGLREVMYTFVASPTRDRIVLIRAWPAESTLRGSLDLAIRTLRIR